MYLLNKLSARVDLQKKSEVVEAIIDEKYLR